MNVEDYKYDNSEEDLNKFTEDYIKDRRSDGSVGSLTEEQLRSAAKKSYTIQRNIFGETSPTNVDKDVNKTTDKAAADKVINKNKTTDNTVAGKETPKANVLPDKTEVKGAGVRGEDLEVGSIMDFAQLITKASIRATMDSAFVANGQTTVHSYIAQSMQRYYHQLYYIPNLQNNMCIVVKPETLFVHPPSCNIIYPNMKSSISFSRDYKHEPTRIIQVTDPLQGIGQRSAAINSLMCLLFIDEKQRTNVDNTPAMRYDMPIYDSYVTSSTEYTNLVKKNANPMALITDYEQRNGIYGTRSNKGSDTFLFLTSMGDKSKYYQIQDNEKTSVGSGLAKLARYELYRSRYVSRTGSISMYFDPYIVPGFPFASLESSEDSCNIYGYVTAVAHSFSDRSWTTVVNFNCAHFDDEASPSAFPIVESEYTTKLDVTYKNMLGDTVKPVNNVDIPALTTKYFAESQRVSTSLRKVWRPLTDLSGYLEKIADGAIIKEGKGYQWFKGDFFDSGLQERIKKYTESIVSKQQPMSNNDVR